MKKILKSFLVALFVVCAACCMTFASSAAENGKWISAWGTAPTQIGLKGYENITAFVGRVMTRSVIMPSASGTKVRIRLSNYYGTKPLTISRASVAKSTGGSSIDGDTACMLKFNGKNSVTIPAGEEIISDPVEFKVNALEEIAVSLFVDRFSEVKTMGLSGSRTYLSIGDSIDVFAPEMGLNSVIDEPGVRQIIRAALGQDLDLLLSYSFIKVTPVLATVDVYSDKDAYSVAVVGDSTVSNEYPQYIAEEIDKQTNGSVKNVGVVGKGIIGNRLGGEGLGYGAYIFGDSMIDRLDRDVISLSGIKYAIVKIGANDIMHPVCTDIQEQYPGITQPTAEDMIENFKVAFEKLHEADIKVIAVGITQWKGNDRDYLGTGAKYVRTKQEFEHDWQIALDVNEWLATTASKYGYHDGYVSYNEKSADPSDPAKFVKDYTIDGAHPSDKLQRLWAQWLPLSLIGVEKKVGAIKLNQDKITLNIGKTKTIKYDVIPSDAVNKTVTWKSTNEKVAVVNSKGKVTAVGKGECEIICTSIDTLVTSKCLVTVNVPVTGVEMKTQQVEVYTTKKVRLSASVLPTNATNKKLKWSSSDKKVATVNSKGVVTAVGSGEATIICKTVSGGYTAKCVVKVLRKTEVENIVLSATKKNVWQSGTFILSASIIPSNATFKDVKYRSTNTKIATVTADGVVYGVAPGTAKIIVSSVDNSFVSRTCNVTVKVKTTAVKLNRTALTVYTGTQKTLVPTVLPLNASNKNVTWKSSNSSVASVNRDGTVTGKKPGKVTITCITNSGKKTADCVVTVKKYIKTKSVSLNRLTCKVYAGSKYTLVATVLPENASSKKLTWKSSNKKVATVDSKGVVTGVSKGTAIITCTTKDSGKKATCEVTVRNVAPKALHLEKKAVSLYVGKTAKLKYSVVPSNTTDKSVTWKSSNKKVATVDSKGNVKAIAPGTATITCTTKSGKLTAKCSVKVSRQKVSSITFKQQTLELIMNKTYTLKPIIKPTGAKNAKLKWESSNTKVVKVDSKGKLTAVGEGSAIVTCKPADGGKGTGSLVVVNVKKNPVIAVKLSKDNVSTSVGKTFKLKATVLPANASIKTVKWSTSDNKVARVDKNGNVKAVGKGYCSIRATSVDGNAIAICSVRVS